MRKNMTHQRSVAATRNRQAMPDYACASSRHQSKQGRLCQQHDPFANGTKAGQPGEFPASHHQQDGQRHLEYPNGRQEQQGKCGNDQECCDNPGSEHGINIAACSFEPVAGAAESAFARLAKSAIACVQARRGKVRP